MKYAVHLTASQFFPRWATRKMSTTNRCSCTHVYVNVFMFAYMRLKFQAGLQTMRGSVPLPLQRLIGQTDQSERAPLGPTIRPCVPWASALGRSMWNNNSVRLSSGSSTLKQSCWISLSTQQFKLTKPPITADLLFKKRKKNTFMFTSTGKDIRAVLKILPNWRLVAIFKKMSSSSKINK